MKRVCINCKKQYGCYNPESKDCGQCDGNCSKSEEMSHGLCALCYPIVLEFNRSMRKQKEA